MGIREHLPSPPSPPPQPSKPPAEEGIIEKIYDGDAGESTDSNIRYAAYAARFRTILSAAHRYVAYTSDIGESFRPVAHPYLIKGAYGVSWVYLTGDVAYEGYKAYLKNKATLAGHPNSSSSGAERVAISEAFASPTASDTIGRHNITTGKDISTPIHTFPLPARAQTNSAPPTATSSSYNTPSTITTPLHNPTAIPFHDDYRTIMVQRAIFQTLASMALPAFTIHSVVRYSGRALKNHKNPRIRTWGPVGLGLAVVPGLPYLFDEPVEHAVEWVFRRGFEVVRGGGTGTAQKVGEGKGGKEL